MNPPRIAMLTPQQTNSFADTLHSSSAWLSTEAGTLAEAASAQLTAGDEVMLEVKLQSLESPQFAHMRIESAPLKTEHVVGVKLVSSRSDSGN